MYVYVSVSVPMSFEVLVTGGQCQVLVLSELVFRGTA